MYMYIFIPFYKHLVIWSGNNYKNLNSISLLILRFRLVDFRLWQSKSIQTTDKLPDR